MNNYCKILLSVGLVVIAIVAIATVIIKFMSMRSVNYFEDMTGVYNATNYIDNSPIIWEKSVFTDNNFPGIDYDVEEKKKVFQFAKNIKPDYAVIDVGAHIGDLAIQLAMALFNAGRKDVTVYAIDPSKDKCNFMQKMIILNKIENIIVINVGLTDKEAYYGPVCFEEKINTGATEWHKTITNGVKKFVTLDSLKLDKKIGLYHINVENLELETLRGSLNTLKNSKPILCIESYLKKKENTDEKIYGKVKKIEDFPELFIFLSEIGYNHLGFMPNDDLIFQ